MINTDDFIKRLEFLMENYGLNASAFADKIGVQRSSISHLLAGRNKPSLDFILKVQDFFPEVNLYWILNGKEKFLKSDHKYDFTPTYKKDVTPNLFENAATENNNAETILKVSPTINDLEKSRPINDVSISNENTEIFKIVIFYRDGTFKDFMKG